MRLMVASNSFKMSILAAGFVVFSAIGVVVAQDGDPIGDLINAVTGSDETAQPLPKPRPKDAGNQLLAFLPGIGSELANIAAKQGNLPQALKAVEEGRILDALALRAGMADPVDNSILTWALVRKKDGLVPYALISEFQRSYQHFPSPVTIRRRSEQALAREITNYQQVLAAYGDADPISVEGIIQKAEALRAAKQDKQAARLIRNLWRESRLSKGFEKEILAKFGDLLRVEDHKFRADMHAYNGRSSEAARIAKLLGSDYQALIRARNAVSDRARNARSRLDKVPNSMRKDAGYIFSKAQHLRRTGHPRDSAAMLQTGPSDPELLVDPDEWWVERRIASRKMLDLGRPQQAYDLAAAHQGGSPATIAEASFHAGWYALRFLNKPDLAKPHFQKIANIASRSRSLARAFYWMGRSDAAAGRRSEARQNYAKAAQYGEVFYGQLAAAELKQDRLNLPANPEVTREIRRRYTKRPAVQAVERLLKIDRSDLAGTFMRGLARSLEDPAEIVLLAKRAEKAGMHEIALQVGRLADANGHRLPTVAFPVAGIPSGAKIPDDVGKGLVYAVARQESGFNATIGSPAGALGLLQLMPATAREVSRRLGLRYAKSKLTKDPVYNVTLGAAYLDQLIDTFDGSLIMTFAGYNAGGSRVRRWVGEYGDPRRMELFDIVDWVERIPFTETRGYVQKILENKQVYQERLHNRELTLVQDLKRGG